MDFISILVTSVSILVTIWSIWQQRRDNNANTVRIEALQAINDGLQKEAGFLRQQNTSLLAQNRRLTELVQYLAQRRGDH